VSQEEEQKADGDEKFVELRQGEGGKDLCVKLTNSWNYFLGNINYVGIVEWNVDPRGEWIDDDDEWGAKKG
jgi:hypothetical protein